MISHIIEIDMVFDMGFGAYLTNVILNGANIVYIIIRTIYKPMLSYMGANKV